MVRDLWRSKTKKILLMREECCSEENMEVAEVAVLYG